MFCRYMLLQDKGMLRLSWTHCFACIEVTGQASSVPTTSNNVCFCLDLQAHTVQVICMLRLLVDRVLAQIEAIRTRLLGPQHQLKSVSALFCYAGYLQSQVVGSRPLA